jgi:PadR family transcriptional regulator PadR
VPELLILRLLELREMYGYELVSRIRSATGSAIDLGEGCVYPLLHSLEDKGYLSCRELEKDGRKRLYYRVTARGKQRLRESTANWERITGAVAGVLGAKNVDIAQA